MSAVIVAMCLGFVFGWVVRSETARAEAGRWHARCDALLTRLSQVTGQRDRWRARARTDALRVRLGPDAWLLSALETVHGEMRPGELAENLTVQARWRDTPDEVLIGIDRGDMTPERALRVVVTLADDAGHQVRGWAYEDVEIPDPGHEAWGS